MIRSKQQGFTLIELIMVIVILGILAATALPKFVDLGSDADAAALKGVAGGAGSAMAINYAGCAVASQTVTTGKCVQVNNCNLVGSLLQGGLDSGYTIANAAIGANGTEVICTLTQTSSSQTATFTGIGAAI